MKQVVVVIGDRLGKGQKVAAGVEAAGGKAIVIPGVAADMKLGDVMNAEKGDIGILLRQRRRRRHHSTEQVRLQSAPRYAFY